MSQCKENKIGVISARFAECLRSLAASFCIAWRCDGDDLFILVKRALQ